MSMLHKEIDEHLYLLEKYLKELKNYLKVSDYLNAHHAANLASYHAARIATDPVCYDARRLARKSEERN